MSFRPYRLPVVLALIATFAASPMTFSQSQPQTAHVHAVSTPGTLRSHGGYYTEERIANLRRNCERYEWAKTRKQAVIKAAAYWVSIPDEELWSMVPGQDLPRCISVTFDRLTSGPRELGCLKCGDEIHRFGNYPYEPDMVGKPWKLTCPSCGAVFPTNDFAKFYASAIDERGLFDAAKGDRSLLYNEEHPDPSDPLHKFGVDDGWGYIDENGRGHRFIGYYTWKYWTHLNNGLSALADAFLFTGDKRYAHKAAILLDRIADVYPDMDWKPYADLGWYHSDGGSYLGKIGGSIWETTVVQRFADAYDKILSGTVDAPELYAFLDKQSRRYKLPNPKGTRELLIRNVDERILRTAFEAVLSAHIRGNQGMHQLTVAMCATSLNTEPTTSQWLDWLFEPQGGAIPGLMINKFDRDGTSNEGAPAYSMIWGRLISQLAERIAVYGHYKRNNIFEDYPQFQATFLAPYRMAAFGIAIPNVGDHGATGLVSNGLIDPQFMAWGYRYTRNPEVAVAAYRANGNSADGLARDIFSEDPEATSREIEALAKAAPSRREKGQLMTGFGLALLESGTAQDGVALAINYGRTDMHGHPDMLNFDLLAFGHWLAPDHGYPEYATKWPTTYEWTGSTISHNTVFVDKKPQQEVWGGHLETFWQLNDFGVVQIDGGKAYPHLKRYTRAMYLVGHDGPEKKPGEAYVVDVFRVNGGKDHVYSFHGPPGTLTHDKLSLTLQEHGTYAGPDIEKGAWAKDFPVGYSHLYNVRRDVSPPSAFVLDWKAEQGYRGLTGDIHLRLHVLTPCDDVALADGDPPQNKPGNPRRLGYVLLHRAGDSLNSTFVSVIEPYRDRPVIRSVTRIPTECPGCVVLRIDRMDGGTDYLIDRDTPGHTLEWAGAEMKGTAALIRESNGEVRRAVLIDGTGLRYRNVRLSSSGPYTGKVLTMNRALKGGGWIIVDQKLPTDSTLVGARITIDPAGPRDACYSIEKVESLGDKSKLYCGNLSFVRAYKGEEVVVRRTAVPIDYDQGYWYDFEEGASFRISQYAEWSAKPKRKTIKRHPKK